MNAVHPSDGNIRSGMQQSLLLLLRTLSLGRFPLGDLHLLALLAMGIGMAIAQALKGDSGAQIRLLVVQEEYVVLAMSLVVIDDDTVRDGARLEASVSLNVSCGCRSWRCRVLSDRRNRKCKHEASYRKFSDLHFVALRVLISTAWMKGDVLPGVAAPFILRRPMVQPKIAFEF